VREAQRPRQVVAEGHQRVLLLDAEPRFFFEARVEDLLGEVAEVGSVRLGEFDVVLSLTQDKDVRCASERVVVEVDWLQEHFGVVTGSLLGGGSIVVPSIEVFEFSDAFAVM